MTRTGAWRGVPPPTRPNARVSLVGRACGGGADEIERARHLTRNERRCAGRLRRGTGTGRYINNRMGGTAVVWFAYACAGFAAPVAPHPTAVLGGCCGANRTEPSRRPPLIVYCTPLCRTRATRRGRCTAWRRARPRGGNPLPLYYPASPCEKEYSTTDGVDVALAAGRFAAMRSRCARWSMPPRATVTAVHRGGVGVGYRVWMGDGA